jgi:hypothetical protein
MGDGVVPCPQWEQLFGRTREDVALEDAKAAITPVRVRQLRMKTQTRLSPS